MVLTTQQVTATSKQPVKSPHTRPALCLQTRCWPIEKISSWRDSVYSLFTFISGGLFSLALYVWLVQQVLTALFSRYVAGAT